MSKIDLQVFNNPTFGEIRVSGTSEQPLFCLTDVCRALSIANVSDCKSRLKQDGVVTTEVIDSMGRKQKAAFVSESNLYKCVFQSRKPDAEAFQDWVCEEVLPKARRALSSLESVVYNGNIDGMVYARDGRPITTSRIIASIFGKNHKDVLAAIDNRIDSDSDLIANFSAMNIKEVDYLSENGRMYREYELTEDGFSFIALSLNGEKADEFKVMYITAFRKMRESMMNMFKAKLLEEVLPQDNKHRQYIYVIKNPLTNLIKIGVAKDVNTRLNQLKTGAGAELELTYRSMICSNAFKIEKLAHNYFQDNRRFGEWFDIHAEDAIAFIEKQSFQFNSSFRF